MDTLSCLWYVRCVCLTARRQICLWKLVSLCVRVCTRVSDHGAALTAAWCQTFRSHEDSACPSVAACWFLAVIGISLHAYGGVNTFACCTLSRLCEVRSAADEFRIISDEVRQLPPMFPPWGNMDLCLPAEFQTQSHISMTDDIIHQMRWIKKKLWRARAQCPITSLRQR